VAFVDAAANGSPAGGSGRAQSRTISGLSVSAPGSTAPNRRRTGFVAAAAVAVVGIAAAVVFAIRGGEKAAQPAAPAITTSTDAPKAVASAGAREVIV